MRSINERVRKLTIQQRNRAVMHNRLAYGLRSLRHRPWAVILLLLLASSTVFICCNLDNPFPFSANMPELLPLWKAIAVLLTVTLGTLLLLGLLVLLGTPHKARSVDNSLEHIGLVDRYGIGPALVSNQKIKGTTARVLTFYSKGIGMERWVQRQGAISDVLACHFVEPIAYGKSSNYIVLTVAPGIGDQRSDLLYDDEI